MRTLKIDPEFRDKLPALTEDEFRQLRESIVHDGIIRDPIVAWNDTIVDGHNRWKIHLEHPEIPFRIQDMNFADKWEAFAWMYANQLGRRNLTETQIEVLRGQHTIARQKTRGGDHKSEKYQKRQIDAFEKREKVADVVAKEQGVTTRAIERAVQTAKGYDAIQKINPKAATMILQEKHGMSKGALRNVARLTEEEQKEVAEAIVAGDASKAEAIARPDKIGNTVKKNRGYSTEMRKERATLDKIYEQMTAAPEQMTDEDESEVLVHEIELSVESFISSVRQTLTIRSTALSKQGTRAEADKVLENAQKEIEKVRNLLCL